MSYEFDLQELEGPIRESDGSRVVEFILGFDAEADTIVVMSVILFPTGRADTLELCFGIRTKTGPNLSGVSAPDYSREGGAKYIPKNHKDAVMALICAAISQLVAEVMPEQITMETYYANLPPEALKKYDVIGAKIIAEGYVVKDAFRQNDGINYWLFKKRN